MAHTVLKFLRQLEPRDGGAIAVPRVASFRLANIDRSGGGGEGGAELRHEMAEHANRLVTHYDVQPLS